MADQTHNDQNDEVQENSENERDAELQALKGRALDVLLPLVDKLEEPPERKFEVLMTAARSSDDPALLGKTLEAAQKIGNDSEKANAVLDVLNEINYHLRG